MGLDIHALKLLLESRQRDVSFESVLTIGRQRCYVDAPDIAALLSITEAIARDLVRECDGYAEPILRRLGARRVDSMDYSAYEYASIIHDMNEVIPPSLVNTFSCVMDFGSLEHVFHFPQAIKNCMEMVAVGGHFIQVTVANNFMGHGFYQFSPELLYRIFSDDNGYVVEDLILSETHADAPWYHAEDPARLRHRGTLVNTRPTYLMLRARKIRNNADILRIPPQQSDYATLWSGGALSEPADPIRPRLPYLRRWIPEWVKAPIRSVRRTRPVGFKAAGFTRRA